MKFKNKEKSEKKGRKKMQSVRKSLRSRWSLAFCPCGGAKSAIFCKAPNLDKTWHHWHRQKPSFELTFSDGSPHETPTI